MKENTYNGKPISELTPEERNAYEYELYRGRI